MAYLVGCIHKLHLYNFGSGSAASTSDKFYVILIEDYIRLCSLCLFVLQASLRIQISTPSDSGDVFLCQFMSVIFPMKL